MNVLPAGFTPPSGVRRTITDECFGMWASSSVYSAKHETQIISKHNMFSRIQSNLDPDNKTDVYSKSRVYAVS